MQAVATARDGLVLGLLVAIGVLRPARVKRSATHNR